jgi:hypothetical protein
MSCSSMFVAMQGKIVESSFKGRPFRVNRASSVGPRLPRTSRCVIPLNHQHHHNHNKRLSRPTQHLLESIVVVPFTLRVLSNELSVGLI